MSNLVKFAERELRSMIDSEHEMNRMMAENIIELLEVFSKQGHSGFSANYALSVFDKLAHFKPFGPLTGADDEWNQIGEGEHLCYQNKRSPDVFKDANGQAYVSSHYAFKDHDRDGYYTCRESRKFIEFPYNTEDSVRIKLKAGETHQQGILRHLRGIEAGQ